MPADVADPEREQEVLDSETSGKIFEMSMGAEGFASRWKFVLVVLVARSHGCEVVGLRRGKLRKVKVVGTKKDAEEASKLFTCLLREIERIVKIECADPPDEILDEVALGYRRSLRAYLDSFRRGAVTALAELMRSAQIAAGVTRNPFLFYVLAAVLYLVLTSLSTYAFDRAEKHANRGVRRA